MSAWFGWAVSSSFRALQKMAPEFFWRSSRGHAEKMASGGARRPSRFQAARAPTVNRRGRVAPSCVALPRGLCQDACGDADDGQDLGLRAGRSLQYFVPNREWTRKFVHACRLRYRRASTSSASAQLPEDQIAAQLHLKKKLSLYCATMALSDTALSTLRRRGCACCLFPRGAGASQEASLSSQRARGKV